LNLSALFSKTGKGVQEASGKTSHLSRADRAVLSSIDGKTRLSEVQEKFEKLTAPKFEALIQQLDKDGFIREVSSGSQSAAPTARAAAPAAKSPPAKADDGDDMDFTQAVKLPPKAPAPAAPKPPQIDLAAAGRADAERKAKEQQALDYRGRQEAETKAKAEAEAKAKAAADARAKADAESKARAAAEATARAEAEARARAEADAKTHAEADAKVKAAREAAVRMATEVKAKAEAEAKTATAAAAGREREALDRARREAEDKARIEADLNAKLEVERKAREDAERRAAEAGERARKELEEKAKKDAEELRLRLEAEMKAKLDEERKAREEEDRKRREEDDRRRAEEDRKRQEADERRREEDERRRKADEERRAREDAERRARDEGDRKKREDDERRRKEDAAQAAAASASLPAIDPVIAPPAPPPAAAAGGGIGDDLLADLDSFGKREEEEQRAKEEAERRAKDDAQRRAKEEAARKAGEEADRKRREGEERKRREEEERRAQEDAERKAREEEERLKEEEAERKRKAKEAVAAKQAAGKAARAAAAKGAGDDDIGVTDDDLGMDDVKRDQKALAERARKLAREQPAVVVASGRPRRWGKPAAIGLLVLLVGGVGLLEVMPISTAEYQTAASEALGAPVKIRSAQLSVITGVKVIFEGVSIGDAVKIRQVRGFPELGSLFGARKAFNRVELEGASLSQAQLADAVLGKAAGENFRLGRVTIKQANLEGPLKLPPLDVDALVSGDGSLQSLTLRGPDNLSVRLSPKGNEVGFEISAGSLAIPFVPALTLSEFSMKGTANRQGVTSSEFDGRAFDGVISGSARIRWGSSWMVDGEVRSRGVKVAVFAPALVSEGKVDGRGAYNMAGSTPATLFEAARLQGEFKIEKGVLGSFDLTRALQTGGAQFGGRTVFTELTGQGVYDKGAVQITNVAIAAGAMNAGASVNVDANGGLSGRITADVKTPTQTLRATLNISGKLQDPVIRK